MSALLEARHIGKTFGGGGLLFNREETVALEDFSLLVDDAQPNILSIAGESGSGKSTLARLLLGIISPTEGEVLYRGKNLQQLSRKEWRLFRQDVQAIFQDPFEVYNPFYKIDHLLTTPISKFNLADSKSEAQELMWEALEKVGLRPEETLGRYPHQLSGGQRQRITIARALLLDPRVIIADEPVSMVDASLRATILESLLDLNRDLGISILYITHDLATAYQLADDIVILYQGSVAEVGDVERVIKEPQHPYTQLLVGSIPRPDPESSWGEEEVVEKVEKDVSGKQVGCKFADRCPHVMGICRESAPPLFQMDDRRAAACYLYDEAPIAETADVSSMFSEAGDHQEKAATGT